MNNNYKIKYNNKVHLTERASLEAAVGPGLLTAEEMAGLKAAKHRPVYVVTTLAALFAAAGLSQGQLMSSDLHLSALQARARAAPSLSSLLASSPRPPIPLPL